MTAKWGSCAMLAICLAILAGCRTPQPNLKPADITKEQFVVPPMETRYETSTYPKLAFDTPTDPNKIRFDDKGAVMPARGGSSGMGGMSGAGGMPR